MWRRLCGAFILASAAALWISFEPFWTRNYYNAVSLFLLAIAGLALWRPSAGVAVLGGAIVLAGNHPGGRTQELWDIVLLLLLGASMLREPPSRQWSRFAGWWLLFVAAGAASIAASELWISLSGYGLNPFYFLSAQEQHPHYPFRVLWWMCISGLLIHQMGPGKFARSFAAGLVVSIAAATGLAILEAVIPQLRPALDSVHIGIDGYVEPSPRRGVWRLLGLELTPLSSNSFFWNRTWFAAFLSVSWGAAGWRLGRHRTRWLVIPALLLGAAASGSRAGILAAAFGTLSLFWLHVMRHRSSVKHIPFVFSLLFLLISPLFIFRPALLAERAPQFQAAINLFLQYPVLGAGIESFAGAAAGSSPLFSQLSLYGTSHNQLLQVLSGMGAAGGLVYVGAFIAAYRYTASPWLRAGLITISIHAAFQEFWYVPSVHLGFWTILAACLRGHGKPNWKLVSLSAGALLAAVAAAHALSRPLELKLLASFPAKPGRLSWTESDGQARRFNPRLTPPTIAGGYALIVPGQPFLLGADRYEIVPLFHGMQTFSVDATIEVYGQGNLRFLRVLCTPPPGYMRKGDRHSQEPCFWLSRESRPAP